MILKLQLVKKGMIAALGRFPVVIEGCGDAEDHVL